MPAPIGDTPATVRPTRDQTLMRQAQIIAERSTCSRAHVGVVIAHEGRIVSQGYNGAPARMPHCDHICDCGYPGEGGLMFVGEHLSSCAQESACTIAVHAEANAIAFAAKHGVATGGAVLFTTMAPCLACAQLIINAGIMRVVYAQPYRFDEGLELLLEAGVMAEFGG
jgi:dCMP deaminase